MDLDATVSFEEAKKAYHLLAKKYHPDVVGNHPCSERNAEAKMKEINLAFRYLAPLLKSKKKIDKTQTKKQYRQTKKNNSISPEKGTFFVFLSKIFQIVLTALKKKEKYRPFENKSGKEKPIKRTKNKNYSFDDVFKSVHPGVSDNKRKPGKDKKEKNPQKTNRYTYYQTYMALKRKMTSNQFRKHQDMSIQRVEKIDPIIPVNPIGKK